MPYNEFKVQESHSHNRSLITAGGAALAGIAGYINVIVLGFFHVPVSHMSGAASRIGGTLISSQFGDLKIVASIIVSFYLGAVMSGFVIAGTQLRPGRRYGAVLIGEGLILAAATFFLSRGGNFGVPLAAMACGLQNAMASSYYGLVIRTTHVTGIVTDLGVITGHRLRGHRVESWKVILLLSLLCGFVTGGIIGAFVLSTENIPALWLASIACIVAGFSYSAWVHFQRIASANANR